jgi:diacylglycerol kinase family enzyme
MTSSLIFIPPPLYGDVNLRNLVQELPMTEPVVQLFVNPRPGRRARHDLAALESAFRDRGAKIVRTKSALSPLHIDPRADHVCVVGGDGTLRHVIHAMHRGARSVPLSVYPAGTINLFARECGYPRSPAGFVARVLSGERIAAHHTAVVGGTPMLTCASVGPDSFAVQALSPLLKRRLGRIAYMIAFVSVLVRWPRVDLTVACDGERRFRCEAVYVAKGRFYAGPWSFAPHARITDPLLHVVAFKTVSRTTVLRFAWALLRGRTTAGIDGVHMLTCKELTISGSTAAPLQADGDIVAWLPATISLRAAPSLFA